MNEKIKICQVTDVHPRYDGRIFRKISVSLKKAGYDVTLLCSDGKGGEEKDGVKFIDAGFLPKNRLKRILHASNALYKKAMEIDADIYHLHDPELLKLGLKLKKKGKKVIFDSHEDVPMQVMAKTYIPAFLRKTISKIVERKEKKALCRFDGVISATSYIAEKLSAFNGNSVAVKNYPRTDNFEDIKRIGAANAVCYVGAINKARGVDTLIDIAKEKGFECIIGGKIPSDFTELSRNLTPNITMTGLLDLDGVKEVYSKSAIGICTLKYTPNHYYSLPIKIFEYMSAGLAVVCSDFPIWKEIVEGEKAGICVNPDDADEIANAIGYLADNMDKVKEFGENGKKAVKEKYNWQTQEKILLDFYKGL